MKTYDDFQEALTDKDRRQFILDAIEEHKRSDFYKEASLAYEYYCKRNHTILEYQKLLYTMSGKAVPDNYSANYKLVNAFFPIFVKQEVAHLLGNGVTFNTDGTKDALGGADFDARLKTAAKMACWGGLSFGFFNLDHVDVYSILEFVPLFGEDDGALHAGIRFWRINRNKPLHVTLFEEDGYTELIYDSDYPDGRITAEKRAYVVVKQRTAVDADEIIDGQNYPSFPVVPFWGNEEHQSELIGLREKIDCYDLIQSGFANDLDDASQIYWTITNAGGMDDIDLVKFVERMKTVKAAVVDDEGSRAEAHTLEVPYNARETLLASLRDSLYRDAMALDTDRITAGSITATAINSAYENLSLKCDDFESCVTAFIRGLLNLAGIDDEPTYKRSKIINMQEETQMVLSAAQYLDTETVLKHLPFLSPDEIETILGKLTQEEAERYGNIDIEDEGTDGQATGKDGASA